MRKENTLLIIIMLGFIIYSLDLKLIYAPKGKQEREMKLFKSTVVIIYSPRELFLLFRGGF